YVHPSLTTMRVDIAELGGRALRVLLEGAAGDGGNATPVEPLVPQLMVRDSSGKRSGGKTGVSAASGMAGHVDTTITAFTKRSRWQMSHIDWPWEGRRHEVHASFHETQPHAARLRAGQLHAAGGPAGPRTVHRRDHPRPGFR